MIDIICVWLYFTSMFSYIRPFERNQSSTMLYLTILLMSMIPVFIGISCSRSPAKKEVISKRVLDNGLTVIVKEDHKSPLIATDTWVMAGYFNEHDSIVGISHLLEHMFFKGTEKREVGELRTDIKKIGGHFGAGTIYEHTHYHSVFPSDVFNEAMEIQSDALRNSTFDAHELEKEKKVVIQEIKRKYDNPAQYSYEMMLDLMFDSHRMGRWRMGTPEEVSGFAREELEDYYRKLYVPENIILAVVGDVDTTEAFDMAEKYYSDWKPDPLSKDYFPAEPIQNEFRRRIMKGDIKQSYINFGFVTPGILDEDTYALQVLAVILGDGRNSRLYRSLVERNRTAGHAAAEVYALQNHGVFKMEIHPNTDDLLQIEREVFAHILDVKDHGVTAGELESAVNRIQSRYLFSLERASDQAENIAMFEQYGDYRYASEHVDKFSEVTVEDVKRAAGKYLQLGRCSMVEYVPEKTAVIDIPADEYAGLLIENLPEVSTPQQEEFAGLTPSTTYTGREDFPPVNFIHPDGKTLIVKENHSLPIVYLQFAFKGGRSHERAGNSGITRLTAMSLVKGSRMYSNEQVAGLIEGTGGVLEPYAQRDYFGFGLRIPSKYLVSAMDIVADIIQRPAFGEDEIEAEREKLLAEIHKNRDRMSSYPHELLYGALYDDYPYGLPEYGIADAVGNLSADDIRDWYDRFKTSKGFYISVAGDVDRGKFNDLVERLFGNLPQEELADKPETVTGSVAESYKIEKREKSQTAQAVGFMTCDRTIDDYYALKILQNIASGQGGRLFVELRDKRSLAYTVYGYNESFADAGAFICYIATNPQNEYTARQGLIRELRKFKTEPVSDEELEAAKAYLKGRYAEFLQTNSGQAGQYLQQEIIGKGIGEVANYPLAASMVTRADVMSVARKYFNDDRMAYGVVRGK